MKLKKLVAFLVSAGILTLAQEDEKPLDQCVEGSDACLNAPEYSLNQIYLIGDFINYQGVCYCAKYYLNPGQFTPTNPDADNGWLPCSNVGKTVETATFWEATVAYPANYIVKNIWGCFFQVNTYSKGEEPEIFESRWTMLNPDDPNCDTTISCTDAVEWQIGKIYKPNDKVCYDGKCWRFQHASQWNCERPDWRPDVWHYIMDIPDNCPMDAEACQYPGKIHPSQWNKYQKYNLTQNVWYGNCCYVKRYGTANDPAPDYPTGHNWVQYNKNCEPENVDPSSATQWDNEQYYTEGSYVIYNECIYTNKWYSHNEEPNQPANWGPWDKIDPTCKEDVDCSDSYQDGEVYQVGDLVCWNDKCWRGTQRSCDRIPDISPYDWYQDDRYSC